MHRILLIDDDTQLGGPLAAYFSRFDMALEHCLRPSDGLARLAQGGIDAAILDVMLPEMDGFLNQFVHETHVFFQYLFWRTKKKKKM